MDMFNNIRHSLKRITEPKSRSKEFIQNAAQRDKKTEYKRKRKKHRGSSKKV